MVRIPLDDASIVYSLIFFRRTETLLQENQDKLEALTQLLLKKETLNYQDVEDLLGTF